MQAPQIALVLHGLLGQGKNWRTFSKRLAEQAAEASGRPWQILTVDLRCHGDSSKQAYDPPHNMESAAQDLLAFVKEELRGVSPAVVVGHSMGGKVALEYLKQTAEGRASVLCPKHVWVLDSQPGEVPDGTMPDVDRVLEAVRTTGVPVKSRQAFIEDMNGAGFSEGLVQWMASNLTQDSRDPGKLTWAFDVAGATAMYESYKSACYWQLLSSPPPGVCLHVLRAAKSDRWTDDMITRLDKALAAGGQQGGGQQGQTLGHVLQDAGHWVHFDQPDALRDMMAESFADVGEPARLAPSASRD